MKDLLMIWPPEVPTSANSFTYHYVDFLEPLSYLSEHGCNVDHINMGLLNQFKQELYIKLLEFPIKVAIYADIHMKQEVTFTYNLIKKISPRSKIIIYGPMTSYYKIDLLKNFDCYISGFGDFEIILYNFVTRDEFKSRVIEGRWLKGDEFVFPNFNMFNPNDYQRLLDLDRNRTQPLNVGLSVTRGCGYKCTYCRMTVRDDIEDRRANISKIVEYILRTKEIYGVKYYKFISPNFGYDKKWCEKLFEELKDLNVEWKCCTRPEYFQSLEFTKKFKDAGCKSVSVGLEVFSDGGYKIIGRSSQLNKALLGIKNLKDSGISVKCLVMLGIPGISDNEIIKEVEFVESLGAVVRPSLYTDYSKVDWTMLEYADKRTPVHVEHLNPYLLKLLYDRKGKMY